MLSEVLFKPEQRRGDWTLTYSGRKFWLEDPRPEDVDINDIAHALSMICRYGGHSREFYSVSQHAILVSKLVCPKHAMFGLMHDASEAYISDIISPLKPLIKNYMEIEATIMDAISKRFGFSMDNDAKQDIKKADRIMLVTEIRDLTNTDISLIKCKEKPLDMHIQTCWGPSEAKSKFLARFYELQGSSN